MKVELDKYFPHQKTANVIPTQSMISKPCSDAHYWDLEKPPLVVLEQTSNGLGSHDINVTYNVGIQLVKPLQCNHTRSKFLIIAFSENCFLDDSM